MQDLLQASGYRKNGKIWTYQDARGAFRYNDGDASETRILNIMQSATDTSLFSKELAGAISDWPSNYHLSPIRANLFRPIKHMLRGPILEIGAGCGAITRFLGEEGHTVLALEGSARRANTIAERCRDLPNVTVLAEPLQHFEVQQKFATVTLIGVLEYARVFFGAEAGQDAIDHMLAKARSFLEPGGQLIIAIENQIGLKYLAGFPEDHLSRPMVGVEDQYTQTGPVTFGKRELSHRVRAAGLPHQKYWFPFPDYKLPRFVLNDEALDADLPTDFSSLIRSAVNTDPQRPSLLAFEQDLAWDVIARNGLQGDLANSFLLVSSDQAIPAHDVMATHFTGGREAHYQKLVRFVRKGNELVVEREALKPSEDDAGRPLKINLENESFENGLLWRDIGKRCLLQDGWSAAHLANWIGVWREALAQHLAGMGHPAPSALTDLIPGSLLDAIPRNLIVGEQQRFIDLEWSYDQPIEFGYLIFRALWDLLSDMRGVAPPTSDTKDKIGDLIFQTFEHLGYDVAAQTIIDYYVADLRFHSSVTGINLQPNASALVAPLGRRINFANIRDLVSQSRKLTEQNQALMQELEAERRKVREMLDAVNGYSLRTA
ncbi:class I SAM-dependent methyltransferase [Rhizobium sp. SIMBA_035]